VVTVAVTPQYQAVQVKPTYSSGYGATARSVSNVVTPKAATNYGYVANSAPQAAYSTPQPATPAYSNSIAVSQAGSGSSE